MNQIVLIKAQKPFQQVSFMTWDASVAVGALRALAFHSVPDCAPHCHMLLLPVPPSPGGLPSLHPQGEGLSLQGTT